MIGIKNNTLRQRGWVFTGLLFFLLALLGEVRGQTLPGNVNPGPNNITNWLRPESANCVSDNCSADTLFSLAPIANNRNAYRGSGTGGGTVTLQTGEINYNPAIQTFGNGYFGFFRNTSNPKIQNSFSGFVVFRTNVVDSQLTNNWYHARALIGGEHASDNDDFGVTMANGKLKYAHQNNNDNYALQPQTVYANNRPHILSILHEKGTTTVGNADSTQMRVDGTSIGVALGLDDPIDTDTIFFGSNLNHADTMRLNAFFGDVIFYDAKVRGFDRDRIETYLALKYGITLGHHYKLLSGAGNVNLYPIDPVYNRGIFGVGRCTSTNFDQRISQSVDYTDVVMLYGSQVPAPAFGTPFVNTNSSYPAIAANDVFLVMGHDGAGTTFTKSLGGIPNNKLGRTYKVCDRGGAGTVTLYFPSTSFTDFGNVTTPGPYYLYYGRDPKLGLGETAVPLINRPGSPNNDYYVQVNFPDNDSVFFTIVRGTIPGGPGGVTTGLELWLEGGKGITNPASITNWADQSGNDHNAACTGTAALSSQASKTINYRPYVEAKGLNRHWSTADRFQGKVIIAVTQGKQRVNLNNEGWLGFEYLGIRQGVKTNGANALRKNGGLEDWANGAGGGAQLRGNGMAVTNTGNLLRNWTLVAARRDTTALTLNVNRNFFIGGFINNEYMDSLMFAEILVYDQGMAGNGGTRHLERLESYLGIKYGITLGHRYRMSNWDGVAATNVYDPTTYGNDIAGLGRDDGGLLYQRQGIPSDSDAVVSIALGTHFPYDTSNTNLIPSDLSFLLAGHNGGGVSCWSSNDLAIPTKRGAYWRVEREWKVQKTGTFTGNFEFMLMTDNPNANLPALPPGSLTYQMFTDPDGNFANGGTVAYPMLLSSPGVYSVQIPESSIAGGTSYFTFGVEVDSLTLGKPTLCVGGNFDVYGSRLGDICTELNLRSGAVNYYARQGVTVNDTTFVLTGDGAGWCLDTLTWRIPLVAAVQNYDLLVDTLTSPTMCNTGFITSNVDNGRQIVDSVLVDSSEVANISWPGDSIYCSNGANVLPIIGPGTTPGVFSVFAGPLVGNPGAILPNPSTGQLLMHTGSVGTHTIRYVTTGGFLCKDTADVVIKVRPVGTPTISYAGSPYCGGTPLSGAALITGTQGGSFRSAVGLVFADTLTGDINIPASASGTYVVSYHPHPDSCATIARDTIVINPSVRAYFDYVDSVYCVGAPPALPLVQFQPPNGQWQEVGAPTGLVINATTGQINLAASPAGTYDIEYSITSGSCTYNAADTITIKLPRDASFSLPNDTLCLSDPAFIPAQTDPTGYFVSLNGLIDVSATDSVTITPSLSTAGGPYDLIHIVPDAYCPDTAALPMYFRGVAAASLSFSDTLLCENDPNPYPLFNSGTTGGTFYSNAGPGFIHASTGVVDIAALGVTTNYDVNYIATDPSCPDTFLVATLDVIATPNASFDILPDSICEQSGAYEVDVSPAPGYSFYLFIGPNAVSGAFSSDTLNVNLLPPGGPYMIQNVQVAGACRDTAYDFITIAEQDTADIAFIPHIVCSNGNDPFPLISGDGGGLFSLISGPGPVTVNPDSGIVTVDSTTALGFYWVRYVTQGFCPSSDSDYVEVRDDLSAEFQYLDNEICEDDSAHYFPVPGFAVGGTFSSNPPGIFFVSNQTGEIDPIASTPGSYTIQYVISSAGSCTDNYVDQMAIVARDTQTTLEYLGSPYCPSDVDPNPILTFSTDSMGLFSGPGLYFANQDSGIISLSATPPDTYIVTFQRTTVCDERFQDTIVIKPAADASFGYPAAIYCIGPNNPTPNFVAAPGGTFSQVTDSSGNNLVVDPTTGEIDLFSSDQGNYYIRYEISPSGQSCGGISDFEVRILPQPAGIALHSTQPDSICERTFVLFTAAGAELVTFWLNGTQVGTGTTWEGINLDSGAVVKAVFTTGLGCKDSIEKTMHVFDRPEADVVSAPLILSGNDAIDIQMLLNTNDTWVEWVVSGIGAVTFDSTDGRSVEGDSAEVVPLGNTVYLDSEINPAQFTYYITPHNFLCTGEPDTVTIRVNPNDRDVFIPQVITPDDNDLNDRWHIQLKNGVDPNLYTIKLFNSAGALVHTMHPLNDTFDGSNSDKGYLPDGVYWYILFGEGNESLETGGLTIRRK